MKSIIVFFLFLPFTILGQDHLSYSILTIDTSLLQNANAIIRDHSTIFDVKNPGTATESVHMVVTRLNAKAAFDDLYVHYDLHKKVKNLRAKIYDLHGRLVRTIKKDAIEDISVVSRGTIYADNRVKYIKLNHGEYPYTIEYEYELEYNGILLYPMWNVQSSFITAVEQSSYTLKLPTDIDCRTKLYNLDVEPQKSIENGKKVLHWQAKNIGGTVYEPGMKNRSKVLASGIFLPSKIESDGYQGDMTSWESYGRFRYKLNRGRDELSPKLAKQVHQLIQNAQTEEEKIAILYRYMQENMRYVSVQLGIGGWQTFDAQYVEKNKYGDCKALSNFMMSLLKEADIVSYVACIYAGKEVPYEMEEDFPYPSSNHVILYVPSTDRWLECTSTDDPPHYVGNFIADRPALLFTEEGGKLVRTPKLLAVDNFYNSNTNIKLQLTGEATFSNAINCGGSFHEQIRSLVTHRTEKQQQESFLQGSDLPMSQIEQFQLSVAADRPEATLNYTLEIPRYATKSGKRLFIPINRANRFNSIPTADNDRINPYFVRNGYSEQDTISIELPELTTIESQPKDVNIESKYGTYRLTYQLEKGKLQCIRSLMIPSQEIPAAEYNTWRDFCKTIAKKDKAKLVVKISQA